MKERETIKETCLYNQVIEVEPVKKMMSDPEPVQGREYNTLLVLN